MNAEKYHKTVADYYDEEAESFEARANDNHVLKTLRGIFRTVVLDGDVENILEIGYGPGLDMVWFADSKRIKTVSGLDITPEFHKIVSSKAENIGKLNPVTSKIVRHPKHCRICTSTSWLLNWIC